MQPFACGGDVLAWLLATTGRRQPLPLLHRWCRRHSLLESFAKRINSVQVQARDIRAGPHPQPDSPPLPPEAHP